MPVLNEPVPQLWWDITYVYEGNETWAIASGDTVEEAQANFKHSLPCAGQAVIMGVKPIPECTGVESMSALCSWG